MIELEHKNDPEITEKIHNHIRDIWGKKYQYERRDPITSALTGHERGIKAYFKELKSKPLKWNMIFGGVKHKWWTEKVDSKDGKEKD